MSTTRRMSVDRAGLAIAALAALALALGACGGDKEKKESTTPEEFLAQERSKLKQNRAEQAEDEASKAAEARQAAEAREAEETRVAEARQEEEDKKEVPPVTPTAAPPTPATTSPTPAAGRTQGPPPTGIVRNALAMVRRGKYEDAIRQAKAALRRDEKYTPAMEVMARAYYHLNKLEFAEAICDIALEIKTNSGICYNLKGFVALKWDNVPLATSHFKKATQVAPNYGPAWLNLGAQYLRVKNYSAAVPVLEKAASLLDNRAEAHLNLGSAYRGNKQLVKAQQSYLKALKLRPTYPAAYYNLGILFLDAQSYPGMDKLQQLNTAVAHFNTYKQQKSYLAKDDPVNSYIEEAQKKHKREQRRREREARRRAREKAKKAPPPTPAPKPAEGGAKEGGGGGAQPAEGDSAAGGGG